MIVTLSNLNSTSTAVSGLDSFTEYIAEISAQSSLGVFSDAATYEVKTNEGGIIDFQLILHIHRRPKI